MDLDIPPDMRLTSQYKATLGHKACHDFAKKNAAFQWVDKDLWQTKKRPKWLTAFFQRVWAPSLWLYHVRCGPEGHRAQGGGSHDHHHCHCHQRDHWFIVIIDVTFFQVFVSYNYCIGCAPPWWSKSLIYKKATLNYFCASGIKTFGGNIASSRWELKVN